MKIFLASKTRSPGPLYALFMMEMIVSSCIRGYHVYGEGRRLWGTVAFGKREPGNVVDPVVAMPWRRRIRVSPLAIFLGRFKMCSMLTQRALDTKISRDQ